MLHQLNKSPAKITCEIITLKLFWHDLVFSIIMYLFYREVQRAGYKIILFKCYIFMILMIDHTYYKNKIWKTWHVFELSAQLFFSWQIQSSSKWSVPFFSCLNKLSLAESDYLKDVFNSLDLDHNFPINPKPLLLWVMFTALTHTAGRWSPALVTLQQVCLSIALQCYSSILLNSKLKSSLCELIFFFISFSPTFFMIKKTSKI